MQWIDSDVDMDRYLAMDTSALVNNDPNCDLEPWDPSWHSKVPDFDKNQKSKSLVDLRCSFKIIYC